MKTTFKKKSEIEPKWYLVDANQKVLGDLAVKLAVILRGKNKPYFSPHIDCGDYVVVINADKIKVTGNKLENKKYYSHSGILGHLKETSLKELMAMATYQEAGKWVVETYDLAIEITLDNGVTLRASEVEFHDSTTNTWRDLITEARDS